jgi:hypothetical protein
LRKDLRNIEGTFVAQVDRGKHSLSTSDITASSRMYRLA